MASYGISAIFNLLPKSYPKTILAIAMAVCLGGCGKEPLEAGHEFMKKGEIASAVIEYKNAVRDTSNSVEARIALANALERSYDFSGAEQQLRKAIEIGGNLDELLPRIALTMLELGNVEKIVAELKDKTLSQSIANSDLHAIVALACIASRRLSLAEEQINLAVEQTPTSSLAKGQLQLAKGKVDEAIAELQGGQAKQSSIEATAWWLPRALARTYQATGNNAKTLDYLQQAHQIAPWHIGILGEYGDALVSASKWDEAAAIRTKLKSTAPNSPWFYLLDSALLAEKGQLEASRAAAMRVLAIVPEHLRATLLVASAELQLNQPALAEDRLRKIARTYSYSLPVLHLLTTAQLRLGHLADAMANIRRGLQISPKDIRFLSLKADTEILQGTFKEATLTLEDLIRLAPEHVDSYLRLSQLKAREGKQEFAAKFMDKAADLGKDDHSIRDRIIAISLRRGNPAVAKQLADYAIKTYPNDPRSHLALTATLAAQNDTSGAWKATIAALDLKSDYQPALNALASLVRSADQHQELLTRYEKAVSAKPTDPLTYLEYVRLMRGKRNSPAEDIAILQKGVAQLPNIPLLREALINENLALGKTDLAITLAQEGAATSGAPLSAQALLATTYERLGKTEQATEAYRKLSNDYPQIAEWRLRFADIELRQGRKDSAKKALQSLIKDLPKDPAAYVKLAHLAVEDNNLNDALSIARQLGDNESTKKIAMVLEGDLLASAVKPDDALKKFVNAAKAGAVPEALLATVRLLDRMKRSQAADEEMAETLKLYADRPVVLSFAARRYLAQGKTDKSIELFGQAVAQDPSNPIALNDLAWAQMVGNKPEALGNAMRAANRLPYHPGVLDTLGMALAVSGKHAEAVTVLQRAVNLSPSDMALRLHLAEAMRSKGDIKPAILVLKELDKERLSKSDQASYQRLLSDLEK